VHQESFINTKSKKSAIGEVKKPDDAHGRKISLKSRRKDGKGGGRRDFEPRRKGQGIIDNWRRGTERIIMWL